MPAGRITSRILVSGAVLASSVAIIAGVTGGGGGGLPAGTANIWVDSNGGTCVDDGGHTYSDATSCSFDAANDTCDGSSDTVLIRGGTYGNVSVTKAGANSGRSSQCVMTVADSQTAVLGNLDLGTFTGGDTGPDFLTLSGNETGWAGCRDITAGTCSLQINGTYDIDQTSNITIANFDANAGGTIGQCFHSEGSSTFVAKRGIIHNCSAMNNQGAMIYTSGTNQTFEDLLVYDNFLLDAGTHTECMYATSVNALTIRRTQMWGCPTEIVFVTGGSTAPDYVLENSIFQTPAGPNNNSFKFRTGGAPTPYPTNILMRNNIFSIISGPDSLASASGTSTNNFFKFGGNYCGGAMVCTGNDTSESDSSFVAPVWTANSDQAAPSTRGNFTITSSSGFRNTGNNGNCPSVDFMGNPRPLGGTCDIGPYEYVE